MPFSSQEILSEFNEVTRAAQETELLLRLSERYHWLLKYKREYFKEWRRFTEAGRAYAKMKVGYNRNLYRNSHPTAVYKAVLKASGTKMTPTPQKPPREAPKPKKVPGGRGRYSPYLDAAGEVGLLLAKAMGMKPAEAAEFTGIPYHCIRYFYAKMRGYRRPKYCPTPEQRLRYKQQRKQRRDGAIL